MHKKTLRNYYHSQNLIANSLNKECEKLDNQYFINYGGCCYVAYILLKLLQNDGYNPKLIIYDSELDDVKSINDLTLAHYHYCIKLGNKIINSADCEGDDLDILELSKVHPKDVFLHYLDHSWNIGYDKTNNNKIANLLKAKYFGIKSDLRKRERKSRGK